MNVFAYGMRLRGCAPGAQPKDGLLRFDDDPLGDYWNILFYTRKLPEADCGAYDLDYLGERVIEQ